MNKKEGVFLYLFLLTSFFLLLEISFFIQSNKMYLADFSSVSDTLHIPWSILPGVLYFLFAQLLVHLGYCLFIWIVTIHCANSLRLTNGQTVFAGIAIWIIGLMTVLAANQYCFPHSRFSDLGSLIFFNRQAAKMAFIVLSLFCSVLFFLAAISIMKWIFKRLLYLLFPVSAAAMAVFLFATQGSVQPVNPATVEKPNIILIGVDSLRPDFLSHFGYKNPTPFFDSFVSRATVFNQALTPLARTFPSWTSILTGQYPRQTGIRFNLAKQNEVILTHTLPAILRRHGYETIYTTDETRFSNIGKNFGFDRIITPPTGLNDFLIGTFNDFPLSNVLVNTPIGKWLFPHSFANRPVYFTYDPDSFIHLIRPALREQRKKPLFLAAHFCLAHHPYLWADSSGKEEDVVKRYEASIQRVDQQVQDFVALLKENHLLDHAIIVLLSDHGEALELHGDRITKNESFISANESNKTVPKFYPPSLDKEEIDQSAGHGTDVLGLTQYYSLLAFKFYGLGRQQESVLSGRVSLMDIKPTVLDLLHLKDDKSAGVSLAAIIKGERKVPSLPGHLFIESDFTPEAIRTVYPETRKVLLEGVQLFQIDPLTTRLTIKDSMGGMILKSKQYADIYGDWMLALYPQSQNTRMPILINLKSGKWTNDLRSSFAQQSPAPRMLAAMKTFYGNEIGKLS